MARHGLPDGIEHWALLLYTDGLVEGGAGRRHLVAEGAVELRSWIADLVNPNVLYGDALWALVERARSESGGALADDVALVAITVPEVATRNGHRPPRASAKRRRIAWSTTANGPPVAGRLPTAVTLCAMSPVAGICEDDDELRGVLRDALEREGFDGPRRPRRARRRVRDVRRATPPDVLVLDIGLPDADGRDVCQALRARGRRAPGAVPHRARRAARPAQRLPRRRRRLPDQAVRARRAARPRRTRCCAAPARPSRASPTGLVARPGGARDRRTASARVPLTPTEFRLLAALAARPGRGRAPRARSSPRAGPTARSCTTTRSTPTSRGSARKLRDGGAPAGDRDGARRRLPRCDELPHAGCCSRRSLTLAVGLGALLVAGNVLLAPARRGRGVERCCSGRADAQIAALHRHADGRARPRDRQRRRRSTARSWVLDGDRVRRAPAGGRRRRSTARAVALGRARRAARGATGPATCALRAAAGARAGGAGAGRRRRRRDSTESLERLQQRGADRLARARRARAARRRRSRSAARWTARCGPSRR